MCLSPRRRPVAPALNHVWWPSATFPVARSVFPGGRFPGPPGAGFARGGGGFRVAKRGPFPFTTPGLRATFPVARMLSSGGTPPEVRVDPH